MHTPHNMRLGYWLLGFNAGRQRYHQTVPGPWQDTVYSGWSQHQDIRVSRLVHRNALSKTTLSLKAFARQSNNFVEDLELPGQQRRVGGWELGVGHRAYVGDAVLDFNLAYKRGTGAFGSRPAVEEAFGEGTSRLQLTSLDAGLQLPFDLAGRPWRYSGNLRAQFHHTPLYACQRDMQMEACAIDFGRKTNRSMKPERLQSITDAAQFFEEIVRFLTMDEKGVPAETYLACAAWMAGAQLFRMAVDGSANVPRGTVVLSEAVNNRLQELMALVSRLASEGPAEGEVAQNSGIETASVPMRLSLVQAQDLLDPIYLSYANRYGLTPEEFLQASVRTAAIAAGKVRQVLGLSLALQIAHYCLLEASKTAPRIAGKKDFSLSHLKRFSPLLPPQSPWHRIAIWLGR